MWFITLISVLIVIYSLFFLFILFFQASGEEPAYLTVGTDVSAKYRGAFCEAKVKIVKKFVKCKVSCDSSSVLQFAGFAATTIN